MALITMATALMGAAAQAAPDASTLLKEVVKAENRAGYTGTQIIKRGNGPREVATVWRDGNRRRIEWQEPAIRKGDVLVDDGTSVWLFHKAENSATQTKSLGIPDYRKSRAVSVRETRYDNKDVYALELSTGALLWVDKSKKIRLRLENGWNSMELRNVKYGPQPNSRFRFSPPQGAKVTRTGGTLYYTLSAARRASPWMKVPSHVPAGYQAESTVVDDATHEVWLRYSNGRRRFSLFQQKAEGEDLAPTRVQGAWFWKSGGIRFLATGAPDDAIPNLAASTK